MYWKKSWNSRRTNHIWIKNVIFLSRVFKKQKKVEKLYREISTCAISGAVGTFANIDPKVETYVAKKLDLKVEPISTQIIPGIGMLNFFQH